MVYSRINLTPSAHAAVSQWPDPCSNTLNDVNWPNNVSQPLIGSSATASGNQVDNDAPNWSVHDGNWYKHPACPDFAIPAEVVRLQEAMGAPVLPSAIGLPQLPPLVAAQLLNNAGHRNHINESPPLLNACVARPVAKAERNSNQAALDAVAKEWHRLRSIKHKKGVGVWDETQVEEKAAVRKRALRDNINVHFARIFDLCVEKGSELPVGHKDRKFKGRAVLQGDQVKDANWEAALFQDLSSSPAAIEASRAADLYGMLEGNDIMVADADQAYTQSYLDSDIVTWVSIPREQWPQKWIDDDMHDPVCPLILSLYGHPDAGGHWERHCGSVLIGAGWRPIANWRSCYWHAACETLLVVYVDDFKMSGPARHKAKLWADITGDPDHPERGGIYMGTPEQQKRFLGCDHTITNHVVADGTNARRMEYNMEPFFRGRLQRWTDLTGQDWHNLPHANTPFLDDDALRKREGIGPLEFRLQPGAVNKSHNKTTRRPNVLPTDPNWTEADKVPSGVLAPVAASSLMQTLCGA